MSIRSAAAAALSPFAHLAGLGPRRASTRRAEEEAPKDPPADEAEEEEEAAPASGEAADQDAPADESDRDEPAAAEGEDGDAPDAPDDEDPDEEMRGSSAAAQARRRERARCAAIFASPHAAGRADVAAQLAFRTTMPRSAAIESLAALARADGGGQRRRPGIDARMEAADNPRLGPARGEPESRKQQIRSGWDRAISMVSGKGA